MAEIGKIRIKYSKTRLAVGFLLIRAYAFWQVLRGWNEAREAKVNAMSDRLANWVANSARAC
jgi:hypothetical protein